MSLDDADGKEDPRHQLVVVGDPPAVLAAARLVAQEWGVDWPDEEGRASPALGREPTPVPSPAPSPAPSPVMSPLMSPVPSFVPLAIPAVAGLRRGEVTGRLWLEAAGAGRLPASVRLRFEVEQERYAVQPLPVAILTSAAFGCLIVLLWPFFPALTPLVPVSVLFGLGAWFLVVAKLTNSGPREFLEAIAERLEPTESS